MCSGVMNIVSSVHEGFHNAPKLYGSDVREPGKVTDFGSGLKEAGKVDDQYIYYGQIFYSDARDSFMDITMG